ncbi:MAG: hypothetical protein QNJ16_13105 [Rhodobacter sp.]|nr:hypothetical protein [Rhodobacter sp.]
MTEQRPIEKPAQGALALRFDWEDWLPYLADSELSEDQKREFIESLWAIVMGFVDLGFHLNPTAEICGETIDLRAVLEAAVLNSNQNAKTRREAAE